MLLHLACSVSSVALQMEFFLIDFVHLQTFLRLLGWLIVASGP